MRKVWRPERLTTRRGTGPDDKETTLEGLVLVVQTYMNPADCAINFCAQTDQLPGSSPEVWETSG